MAKVTGVAAVVGGVKALVSGKAKVVGVAAVVGGVKALVSGKARVVGVAAVVGGVKALVSGRAKVVGVAAVVGGGREGSQCRAEQVMSQWVYRSLPSCQVVGCSEAGVLPGGGSARRGFCQAQVEGSLSLCPSPRGTRHVARHKCLMRCMRFTHDYLLIVCDEDSSRRSEIVK